jgi:hypothetical protein
MIQQFARVPGVLAGNPIDFFQDPQGAQRDVFQVPYGSCDDMKYTGHSTRALASLACPMFA